MCKAASMVLTKDRIFWSKRSESHENIIEEYGLCADGLVGTNVVRIEITPPDNRYDLPPEQWGFRVDQMPSELPEWFTAEEAEARVRRALPAWIEHKVLLTGHTHRITDHRVIIAGNASIGKICEGAHIDRIGGSATVLNIGDTASVVLICDNARIDHVWGRAYIEHLHGSAFIEMFGGYGCVSRMSGSAHIDTLYENAFVHGLSGDAEIRNAVQGASIGLVSDQARVPKFSGRLVRFENKFTCKLSGILALLLDMLYFSKIKVHRGGDRARIVTNITKAPKPRAKKVKKSGQPASD